MQRKLKLFLRSVVGCVLTESFAYIYRAVNTFFAKSSILQLFSVYIAYTYKKSQTYINIDAVIGDP